MWTRELFLRRFVPKVEFGEHWIWKQGADKKGYCRMWWQGKPMLAHRLSYAFFNGKLLPDHEVHHDCKIQQCVHPDHLVQCKLGNHHDFHAKNPTHCPKGHPLVGWNVLVNTRGNRQCRKCARDSSYRSRKRRVRVNAN